MKFDHLSLVILTPEKEFFRGDVASVTLPGTKGRFQVLPNHAPLISSLQEGDVVYVVGSEEQTLHVRNGFVEVNGENVNVCVEL